jgi:hypothetical protein
MSEELAKELSQADSLQQLERIRDIIFGNQAREFQQLIETIQRDLNRHQQQIDQLGEQLEEQDASQGKKLQTLRRDMRQADDDLRAELRQSAQRLTIDKVERTDLGRLFVELGTHLESGGTVSELLQNLIEAEQDPDRDG